MNKKIVAIGGGEIDNIETLEIDKEIIKLSEKKYPNFLFIPTASGDSEGYCENIYNYYGKKLKCNIDYLKLIKEKLSFEEIKSKIDNADIIYVGGGNTLKMMTIWRKLGVDNLLIEAYKKGTVMCGLSAGSICWFKFGCSDSRKFTSNSNKLIKVSGLGLINALHCPHYDKEENRKLILQNMMKNTYKLVAIALDNCCAIEIINDTYRIIRSNEKGKAYKVYWKNGNYIKKEIAITDEYNQISELLEKK